MTKTNWKERAESAEKCLRREIEAFREAEKIKPPRCPGHLAGTQPVPIQCGFPEHKGGQHAGLNDTGEVVWFPADPVVEVAKEYGVKHANGVVSVRTEYDARYWASRYPETSRLMSRTAPGPWQDS